MTETFPILVLGLKPGSLEPPSGTVPDLADADLLVGGKRLLDSVSENLTPGARRIPITARLAETMGEIGLACDRGERVVVLADGDPLFFGIGARLVREFGIERVTVIPSVTAVQEACARMGVAWDRTAFISLHGRSDYTPLYAALMEADTICVLTDAQNDPGEVARAMLERGADCFSMTVLESLGTAAETVRKVDLRDTWGMEFHTLNIVFLEREYHAEIPLSLGIPDNYYMHQRGLITKLPVRATGLALLGIQPDSVVWDLGAGCGSVGIEASYLARRGQVYAVERDRTRASMISENVRRMGAWMVEVVIGETPGCLAHLPDPDKVFIGGGLGGEANADSTLLEEVCTRLKSGGTLVIHCILLESLLRAKAYIEKLGWNLTIHQVQLSSTDRLAGDLRFRGENPVFIVQTSKP